MIVIVCALLAVGAIGFTLFIRDQDIPPAPVENPELKHLETQRQVLYDNLKDLQFEYHQGKLSGEDYQSLKQGFSNELAVVLESIDRLQQAKPHSARTGKQQRPEGKAATEPAPKQTQVVSALQCSSCGNLNPVTNRFCGSCGSALS